jgi:ATP/maltotriose-dependent transcriptional regulator MalT
MTAGTSAPQTDDHASRVDSLILDCLLARCRRKTDVLNKAEVNLRLVATRREYGYYLLAAARREPVVNDLASAMDLIREAGSYLPKRNLRTTIEQSLTAGHAHLVEGLVPEAVCYYLQSYLLMRALGSRAPLQLWHETVSGMLMSLRATGNVEAL